MVVLWDRRDAVEYSFSVIDSPLKNRSTNLHQPTGPRRWKKDLKRISTKDSKIVQCPTRPPGTKIQKLGELKKQEKGPLYKGVTVLDM